MFTDSKTKGLSKGSDSLDPRREGRLQSTQGCPVLCLPQALPFSEPLWVMAAVSIQEDSHSLSLFLQKTSSCSGGARQSYSICQQKPAQVQCLVLLTSSGQLLWPLTPHLAPLEQKEPQAARAKARIESTQISTKEVLQDREKKSKLTTISARTSGTLANHF